MYTVRKFNFFALRQRRAVRTGARETMVNDKEEIYTVPSIFFSSSSHGIDVGRKRREGNGES